MVAGGSAAVALVLSGYVQVPAAVSTALAAGLALVALGRLRAHGTRRTA